MASVILLSWERVVNVTNSTLFQYVYEVKMRTINTAWISFSAIIDNGPINETLKYYIHNLSANTTYFFQVVPWRINYYYNKTEAGNASEEVRTMIPNSVIPTDSSGIALIF